MSRKKPALGLDPKVGTGFAKKDMLKQRGPGSVCRPDGRTGQYPEPTRALRARMKE